MSCEDWRAEVAPHIGGSILSLTRAGRAILRPTPQEGVDELAVRRTACYPLVPYANRIAGGRFFWNGAAYCLRENFPASRHPLHGVGWRRAWHVFRADEQCCELHLQHRPAGDDLHDWPFAFDATQVIRLDAAGLTLRLSITNAQSAEAPLGLGLHPLFPRGGTERLTFSAAGAWCNNAEMLPSAPVSGGPWDHSASQAIGAQALDHDFIDWRGTAVIEAPGVPAVRLGASSIFSTLRVFTPPGKDFFAVEPVSHSADAINRADCAGMFRAPPGACLAGSMTIGTDE